MVVLMNNLFNNNNNNFKKNNFIKNKITLSSLLSFLESRNYSLKADDYWNREYLDYADNNWYNEQHFVRILTPILERIFS